MPIQIHNKSYFTVAERLTGLHEEFSDGPLTIFTAVLSEDEKQVTVQAVVTTPRGTFHGHARSRKGSGGIEQQSDLEVAETSAVGRALAFAGFGAIESVASAEEVIVAQGRESPFTTARARLDEPPNPAPLNVPSVAACPHGARVWKQGTSKTGQSYRGWFCPASIKECKPVWVNEKPAMAADSEGDTPFAGNEDPGYH